MKLRPQPLDLLDRVAQRTGLHPSLILDPECRAYHAERAMYAKLLRNRLGMTYEAIAEEAGYRDASGARHAIKKAVDKIVIGMADDGSALDSLSMTSCIGKHGAFAGIGKKRDGTYIVIRLDKPGEYRTAKTSMEAWSVAEAWLEEEPRTKGAA